MKKIIAILFAAATFFAGGVSADTPKNPQCWTGGVNFCLSTGGAPAGGSD